MAAKEITLIRSQAIVGLLIMGGIGLGVYAFIAALLDKLNTINSDLGKAIIAGSVTIFAAIVTGVFGKIWETRLRIQADVRDRKIPVYEHHINTFFRVLMASSLGEQPLGGVELQKAFLEFTQKLIIWGGPQVIRAWSEFRTHDWSETTPIDGFRRFDALLFAIRKELGNSNWGIKTGDLIQLLIASEDKSKVVESRPISPALDSIGQN